VKDGVLIAKLSLTNTSNSPVDLIVARRNGPGAYVTAEAGETRLEAILDRGQQADLVSRMGPMPKYGVILANQQLDAGTFRFRLPAGFKAGQVVHLRASVAGPAGASATFAIDIGGEVGV
jgi:hypothetical protein